MGNQSGRHVALTTSAEIRWRFLHWDLRLYHMVRKVEAFFDKWKMNSNSLMCWIRYHLIFKQQYKALQGMEGLFYCFVHPRIESFDQLFLDMRDPPPAPEPPLRLNLTNNERVKAFMAIINSYSQNETIVQCSESLECAASWYVMVTFLWLIIHWEHVENPSWSPRTVLTVENPWNRWSFPGRSWFHKRSTGAWLHWSHYADEVMVSSRSQRWRDKYLRENTRYLSLFVWCPIILSR